MTNDTSGRVPGASRVSRDTPDLSWTPFLTGPQGPDPLTSKRHPKRAYSHPGTTGSWNKLQTTFRNSTSPLPHLRPARAKAKTGQNHRKTTRYSGDHPTQLKPKITKLPSLHISLPLSPFPGLDFPFEASSITFWQHEESGPKATNRVQPCPNDVPFPPTTSSSRAITFKGFLTTLTLPREEVVKIRGPIHSAQPPFHLFFLYRVPFPLPSFLSRFQACLGFSTFGTTHKRLDPSLRSPTSPIPHHAVARASVASNQVLRLPRPLPRLFPSYIEARGVGSERRRSAWTRRGHRASRPSIMKEGQKVVSEGSVAPRGPTAIPFATGTVRFLGPPEALGLFLLEAEGRVDVDLRKCGLYHVHITWCMRGTVRNNVKDPPKLKPGQGVFGHSPLRGGRAIRDLVGVSVGLSFLPKSILGIVRNYVSF
ncbi:hypothetical protein CRG98_023511 [Punica granatum]|uniref:Uncharacterized protein n=1 Tax=Punica granatum TaxID=22663 RepID=A0A2I0JIK2_PUNGR|nr:hypothetical protein CRG98_023511 [Punica granatum]